MPGAVTNKSVVCVHRNDCAAWDLGSNHMVLYLPEMTCMVSAQILTGMTKFELTPLNQLQYIPNLLMVIDPMKMNAELSLGYSSLKFLK